jgi:4-hydroxybenzoate polyprenyltransferase
MRAISAYARAAHFGPTMLITTISFLLASRLWWEGPAYVIAFTVFLGQLLIGWSNDINDYQDDLKHNRVNKPLVSGQLQIENLKKATFILLPIALLANLLGPLGLKGGAVYLLGVGCGIAYNFYFKFRITSPLVYFIALAALPASIFYAVDRNPPLWVLATSSLLGVAFHFANVLKDLSADRDSNIGGLPQRLGRRASLVIIAILLVIVITILLNSPISSTFTSRVI